MTVGTLLRLKARAICRGIRDPHVFPVAAPSPYFFVEEGQPVKVKLATFEKILIALVCLVGLFLIFSGRAHAQTQPPVTASAQVTWTLPTLTTDGKPLTGADALTKLQVFASPATIPDSTSATPTAELGPTATSYAYTTIVPNGTTLYFRLRACIQQCGALSNEASKLIRVAIPGVATGVSVTVTVTVNIATP